MKKTLTLLTLTLSSLSLFSQSQTSTLSGKVTDGAKKPAEAATVSLLHAKDSSVARVLTTDISGKYSFNAIAAGKYLVMVTAVGHEKTYSAPVSLEGENVAVEIPGITLKATSKEMGAVTVTARKPFIEQKIDRTVVNVDAAVTNAGSTALEVLEKSPGVTVDKDGAISLKGKQGVMVMMDGRPTYLSADQLASLLKSMPASSIDQIEIITNPSAKYDAAGNSGIINIKTKKNKQRGFNGSLTLNYGQGKYWKTNNSFNLNYRTGKVNIFANGGYSRWNGFQQLEIKRKYRDAGSKELTAIFEQVSYMKNENENYSLKLGADYYLSSKTTLGIVLNGNMSPENQRGTNTSNLMNNQGVTDSVLYATSYNEDLWKNKSINLNLRHQFDTTGRELTADIDLVNYGSNSKQLFNNTMFDPSMNEKSFNQLKGNLPVDISIYSAKIDYTQPLKDGGKLEAGLKGSMVNTDNFAGYYNLIDNAWEVDYRKTNNFKYEENILAAYVNYNRQINKWGIQGGLRYEHTSYRGNQFGNPTAKDSSFKRNYGSLFPTVFVTYKANEKNTFGLSLGRRIDRPAYQDLNPFLFFIDQYTMGQGNPYLQPQFTQNVELSHTFKSYLTTTINYSTTRDYMNETFDNGNDSQSGSNEEFVTVVRQGNIGRRQNAGISVSAQVPVQKWWTAILYTNYNYNTFDGELNGEQLEVSGGTMMFNVNNQFKFSKGWSAELSGWYRTKGIDGQILIDPMYAVSGGLAKQVLKNKGTVKLNVRDIFYTQKPQGDIAFKTTEAWFRNSRDSRVVNISFVYRFGKPLKDSKPSRKSGGAGDEQNRVKMGGNN